MHLQLQNVSIFDRRGPRWLLSQFIEHHNPLCEANVSSKIPRKVYICKVNCLSAAMVMINNIIPAENPRTHTISLSHAYTRIRYTNAMPVNSLAGQLHRVYERSKGKNVAGRWHRTNSNHMASFEHTVVPLRYCSPCCCCIVCGPGTTQTKRKKTRKASQDQMVLRLYGAQKVIPERFPFHSVQFTLGRQLVQIALVLAGFFLLKISWFTCSGCLLCCVFFAVENRNNRVCAIVFSINRYLINVKLRTFHKFRSFQYKF